MPAFIPQYFERTLQIKHGEGYCSSLTNLQPFTKGDVVGSFKSTMTLSDKRYSTVQIDANTNIELNSELVFINHSCDPNVYIDTKNMQFVALKDLPVGTELTFFYPSTEWTMQQPFECWCGASNCLKEVKGARFIDGKILEKHLLSDHVTKLMNDRDRTEKAVAL
ncbi:hypothetical protein SeMB42_g04702 [Synchytrium endobioticum]|uniref:SET domain-containing protein n=1 Tax=Synchytrium endobioticum TaxID=286115 RepID=A0A507CWI1_9FUNG|nr:hypothetical protein SeMB42_g04702 [Synchytrium endobioticum]TPX49500.1 hypothetical protein SeLEV6574_g01414 [Synchytrium endobioticum]